MISASVSLSVSCTVQVFGAGPVSYPLNSLQSVSSLSVADCLASDASTTNCRIFSCIAVVSILMLTLSCDLETKVPGIVSTGEWRPAVEDLGWPGS